MSGDHRLRLRDGRTLAWHEWGDPGGAVLLRLHGTPGSRLTRYYDTGLWQRLGLRVITVDRPGYGASDPRPGRTFGDFAGDLVELLDDLALDRVRVSGGSGGGPHALAFAAGHPDRVIACGVMVGASPLVEDEVERLIPVNREGHAVARRGREAMWEFLRPYREAMLADPLASFRRLMAEAPEADQKVLSDPRWQATFVEGLAEALRPGLDGWVDDSMLMSAPAWDFDVSAITAPVDWWHGAGDANAPLSATRRACERIPGVTLHVHESSGHMLSFHLEEEMLTTLLGRAR